MMKKKFILGVILCCFLALLMACSDDSSSDSNDPVASVDENDCTAKKVKKDDRSGYVLSCNSEVIDTLWDEKIDQKIDCTTKKVKEDDRSGYVLSCNSEVIDTLWDGKNDQNGDSDEGEYDCVTAKFSKDEKNGVVVSCGGVVVDTIWNEFDEIPGSINEIENNCTAKLIEINGSVGIEMSCDVSGVDSLWSCDGKTFDPNKALCKKDVLYSCGEKAYDPDTALCKSGVIYSCGGMAYDPDSALCKENKLFSCKGVPYDPDTHYCQNKMDVSEYGKLSYGGQDYKTIVISDQTWMAENLNYGDSVENPNLKGATWCGGGEGDKQGDCSKYGRLYTWTAAVNKSESECGKGVKCDLSEMKIVQGICPDGWHLPNDADFEELLNSVDNRGYSGADLKSVSGWNDKDVVRGFGLDAYGFNAIPAGAYSDGKFSATGKNALFWSSSLDASFEYPSIFWLKYNDEKASLVSQISKSIGQSVRCIMN